MTPKKKNKPRTIHVAYPTPEFNVALCNAAEVVTRRVFGIESTLSIARRPVKFKSFLRPSQLLACTLNESAPLTTFQRAVVAWSGPIAMVIAGHPNRADNYEHSPGEIVSEVGALTKEQKEAIRCSKRFRQTFAAAMDIVRENSDVICKLAEELLSKQKLERFESFTVKGGKIV